MSGDHCGDLCSESAYQRDRSADVSRMFGREQVNELGMQSARPRYDIPPIDLFL